MYLSKFKNVFVSISKYICLNFRLYFSKSEIVFVWIKKCTLKHVGEVSRLRASKHLGKMLWFTHLSGENFQLPGTFNYFELFIRVSTFTFEMHHHFVFLWTQFKLIKFYIWIIESVICVIWFHSYRVDLNCDIWHGFGVNNISHNTGFIQREKV